MFKREKVLDLLEIEKEERICELEAQVAQLEAQLAQMQFERHLNIEEQLFQQIFDDSRTVQLIADPITRHIIRANPAASAFYGIHPRHMMNLPLARLHARGEAEANQTWDELVAALRTMPARDEVLHHQEHVACGERRRVEIQASLITLRERELLHLIVTDRAEDLDSLQQTIDALLEQERTRILSDFIQHASHEFKTPLTIINSGLFLMERSQDTTYRRNKATLIEKQIRVMTDLIDKMVVMARLGASDTLPLEPRECNLVLEQSLQGIYFAIDEKELTVETDFAPEQPLIDCNSVELDRALYNIFDNAIQFTPQGGGINARSIVSDQNVVITISDTGSGVSETDQLRAFERFYRGDNRQSERGFGLGLPMAKRIIELHGGTIQLGSNAMAGTTVTITLPRLD